MLNGHCHDGQVIVSFLSFTSVKISGGLLSSISVYASRNLMDQSTHLVPKVSNSNTMTIESFLGIIMPLGPIYGKGENLWACSIPV